MTATEAANVPLAQRYAVTLEPTLQVDDYGPLLARGERDTETTWVLSPLFSATRDPAVEAKEFDLVYPLLSYDRFGAEYRLQLLQILSFSGGRDQQAMPTKRVTLFPLYFHQHSADTHQNYTAWVPFYGNLKHRLFRDEVRFVLLPLYLRTRKQEVVTDNYLFPIFHRRAGRGLHGWQFWPLVGREHKDITTRTNTLDEVETVGGHDKFFALWPLYFHENTGIGTENPEKFRALIPLFARQRSPQRDSTTYLWPLFTYTDDREKRYHEWDAPWPLVVFARGEGKTANRAWPLFGHARNATLQSDFFLWPFYKYNRFHSETFERERTRILFFLYSDTIERETNSPPRFHRTDLWPLFTAKGDAQGNERLQILSVLEPLVPTSKSIERNYSPLWALWRSEKNLKAGAASQSVLWSLYRHQRTPTMKKYSLLFGLFQYQSGAAGHRWRLFYVPLGRPHAAAAAPAKH